MMQKLTLRDYLDKTEEEEGEEFIYKCPKYAQTLYTFTNPYKKLITYSGYFTLLTASTAYYFIYLTDYDFHMWTVFLGIFVLMTLTETPNILKRAYEWDLFFSNIKKNITLMEFYVKLAEKKSYKELTIKKDHPLCEMITRIFTQYTYSDSVSISVSYDNKSTCFSFNDKEMPLQDLFLMLGGEDWHPFIWIPQRRRVFAVESKKYQHYHLVILFITIVTICSMFIPGMTPEVFSLNFVVGFMTIFHMMVWLNYFDECYFQYRDLLPNLPKISE
jgi:hypothetical protein